MLSRFTEQALKLYKTFYATFKYLPTEQLKGKIKIKRQCFKNNKIDFHLLWDEKYNNGTYDLKWLVADGRVENNLLLCRTQRARGAPGPWSPGGPGALEPWGPRGAKPGRVEPQLES